MFLAGFDFAAGMAAFVGVVVVVILFGVIFVHLLTRWRNLRKKIERHRRTLKDPLENSLHERREARHVLAQFKMDPLCSEWEREQLEILLTFDQEQAQRDEESAQQEQQQQQEKERHRQQQRQEYMMAWRDYNLALDALRYENEKYCAALMQGAEYNRSELDKLNEEVKLRSNQLEALRGETKE